MFNTLFFILSNAYVSLHIHQPQVLRRLLHPGLARLPEQAARFVLTPLPGSHYPTGMHRFGQ
ncbi:hypothetical protein, partial [Paraprevotella clara]|uniref:hypothetical protein n=1 Tax=Paraprevotella clara TaxID=454154 RepID=UPI003AB7115C